MPTDLLKEGAKNFEKLKFFGWPILRHNFHGNSGVGFGMQGHQCWEKRDLISKFKIKGEKNKEDL